MLILVLAGVLSASTARAADVGVVVTGEATLQPQLASALEGWLHDHGRTVMPSPLEPEAINRLIDCFVLEDLGCARDVIDQKARAQAVVFARIEVSPRGDGMRDVAVSAYWVEKNHETIGERRVCERCTDEKLRTTADSLMILLAAEPPVAAGPVPTPAGAGGGPSDEQPASARALPLGLMGAGGLALVIGGIMIAIDQDPDPHGPQQPSYRDTAPAGTVLAITGAAALGVGAYLWFHGSSHSTPVAAISHDGAYVGWAGRF